MIEDIIKEKGCVNNMWSTMDSPWSTELAAHAGFDSITFDAQHGLGADHNQLVSMMQAVNTTSTLPLVRVSWPSPHLVMQALDMGASGVICPMINDAEDTRQFVAACMYPPEGIRSFGPARPLLRDPDYFKTANTSVCKLAMIETKAAYDNREAIAAVPYLDGIYIGPYDLSIALGHTKVADFDSEELNTVLDTIAELCNKHNIIAGIHCPNPVVAKRMKAKGFTFITTTIDSTLFNAALKQVVVDFNKL